MSTLLSLKIFLLKKISNINFGSTVGVRGCRASQRERVGTHRVLECPLVLVSTYFTFQSGIILCQHQYIYYYQIYIVKVITSLTLFIHMNCQNKPPNKRCPSRKVYKKAFYTIVYRLFVFKPLTYEKKTTLTTQMIQDRC